MVLQEGLWTEEEEVGLRISAGGLRMVAGLGPYAKDLDLIL